MLRIGSRVTTHTGRQGIIRFIGQIKGENNTYHYVEWDDDKGFVYPTQENTLNQIMQHQVQQQKEEEEQQSQQDNSSSDEQGEGQESSSSSPPQQPAEAGEVSQKEQGEMEEGEQSSLPPPADFKMPEYVYNEEKKQHKISNDKKVQLEKLDKKIERHDRYDKHEYSYDNNYEKPSDDYDKLFYISRIKNILRDNASERKVGGQRSGDLHFKKLWKIQVSDRIFQRKAIISAKKYNVALLVDCSGSMSGHRSLRATQAAELFIREFQKFCNISVGGYGCDYELIKPFGKEKYSEEEIDKVAKVLYTKGYFRGGSTNESGALKAAINSFKGMEGQNIIVTMCDGGPNDDAAVHHQLERARLKNIHPIGIGIETNSVEYFYNLWARVDNAKDIYPAMTQVLSKAMRRSIGVS